MEESGVFLSSCRKEMARQLTVNKNKSQKIKKTVDKCLKT